MFPVCVRFICYCGRHPLPYTILPCYIFVCYLFVILAGRQEPPSAIHNIALVFDFDNAFLHNHQIFIVFNGCNLGSNLSYPTLICTIIDLICYRSYWPFNNKDLERLAFLEHGTWDSCTRN